MGFAERGASLIEILIALLLLSFMLLSVAPMFLYASRNNAAGADIGTVGALGVERMEQLRRTAYTALNAGGSLTADMTVGGTPYFDASVPGYVVRWRIVDSATPDGGKRIDVRALALRQVAGQPKEVTLSSLRAG